MSLLDASDSRPLTGGPSFGFKHRLFRVLWNFCWFIFAAWTPAPFHRWRVFLLNLFGAHVHGSAHVYGSARIWYPSNLFMEQYSCLGPRVNCYSMARIELRLGAIVSQGAQLCAGTHNIRDVDFQLIVKPIVIGERAWIAAEAFVGPGVVIGDYSVVGARAVVFKNTDLGLIYVGNPAKAIGSRYS